MKTTKDLFEVYKPKSPDEQKFVDKHVVIKHKDRNGNGDDVFNGNTKTIKRKEERHGYDVGEDEKVYEETEAEKNTKDTKKTFPNVKYFTKSGHPDWKKHGIDNPVKEAVGDIIVKSKSSADAYAQHTGQMTKKSSVPKDPKTGKTLYQKITSEEVEDLDEGEGIVTPKKGMSYAIRSSDAYRKYAKENPHMLAKKTNEEVEELDEVSKGTLSSYVIKATHPSRENSISNLASKGGFKNATSLVGSDDDRDPNKNGEKEDSKSAKRSLGVIRAVSKLTKEDIINRTIEKYITPEMPEPLTMEERLVSKIDDLSESHIYLLLNLFETLNEDNQFRMLEQVKTPEGVTELLDFAIENRGV